MKQKQAQQGALNGQWCVLKKMLCDAYHVDVHATADSSKYVKYVRVYNEIAICSHL